MNGKKSGLPVDEFFHPVPIFAIIGMAINDHYLKGSGLLPTEITGKLSDILGMIFFPLFMTAAFDTVLYGVNYFACRKNRNAIPYALTQTKLIIAIIATAIGFSALQLSPTAVRIYAFVHHLLGIRVAVTQDATDLIALPFLAVAYIVGAQQIFSPKD